MNTYKFTQPVSMQVNQEQFDSLKPKLEALGYVFSDMFFSFKRGDRFICTNSTGNNNSVNHYEEKNKLDCNRHFIDHYNPELFLAIAAMTDAEYGIAGEHWVFISDSRNNFTKGSIYKQTKPHSEYKAFIDNKGSEDGWCGENEKYFRRATLPELISHYTKPKTDMSTETRNVQLSLEQAKALYEANKEQYAWLLTTFPELEQPKAVTWEGLKEVTGWYVSSASKVLYEQNKSACDNMRNLYRTEAQARGALAQSMITQLLPVYNGNWVAEWSLTSARKYSVCLSGKEWQVIPRTTVNSTILNFKDRPTAERFLTEQSELLEQYKGLFIEPKNS